MGSLGTPCIPPDLVRVPAFLPGDRLLMQEAGWLFTWLVLLSEIPLAEILIFLSTLHLEICLICMKSVLRVSSF